MDRLTTQFKVFVAFALIVVAFAFVGFNQLTLKKEVDTAISSSTQAVNLSTQTYKDVKALAPTVAPTATPSAMKVTPTVKFTPVKK